MDDHEPEAARQGLGAREPTGLPNEQIGRRHVLVHLGRVAHHVERGGHVRRAGGRTLVEPRFQLGAAPADHHELDRMPEFEERVDQSLDRAHPEAAG